MGLIVDTSVWIAAERERRTPEPVLEQINRTHGETRISISVLSVIELDHGIYRAKNESHLSIRRRFCEGLYRIVPILPLTLEIARLAGRIEGEQAARGIAIPLADLLIGCTALHLGDSVLTSNPKHFALIPSLSVLTL
jgi:tRNA(fMet)-specific endonuclease VapC